MKALLLLALFTAVLANDDPCSPAPDCQTCVDTKDHICGWCSKNVIYKSGLTGAHCVSNDGTHPFACYGVFSTQDCLPGYVCNNDTRTCDQTAPGQGTSYAECVAECGPAPPGPSPPAPMYICNETSKSCEQNPSGESLNVCLQQCAPAPATPSAPTPVDDVYLCDNTTYTCKQVPPGTPGSTSKLICEGQCQPKYYCDFGNYQCFQGPNGTSTQDHCKEICVPLYRCDVDHGQCVVAPPPTPGVPLADCEKLCKHSNNTPGDLAGIWRGLQVNKDYDAGEWDIQFLNGTASIVTKGGVGFSGPATFYGTPDLQQLTLTVTASTLSTVKVGDLLNMTYASDGATPETRFLMVGSGAPNGAAPTNWASAMASTVGWVWSSMVCQPATACVFEFGAKLAQFHSAVATGSKFNAQGFWQPQVEDRCMSHGGSCTECLAVSGVSCGWCTAEVVYQDGTKGTHCAGDGTKFNCSGIYRTDDCNDYQCIMPQATCYKVPLGSGQSKEACEKDCHPAPPSPSPLPPPPGPSPPAPPAPMYACNHSSFQCYQHASGTSLHVCQSECTPVPSPATPSAPTPVAATYSCNETSKECYRAQPGHGTSLPICENMCRSTPPPPSPGPPPPPVFHGTWRGLQIDNAAPFGEFVMKFNNNDFILYLDGAEEAHGSMYSDGSTGNLIIDYSTGTKVAAIYALTDGLELLHITMVVSKDLTPPDGFDKPWILGHANGNEWVFLQDHSEM